MASPSHRSYDVHVPNKTIYVSDGDLPLYQRAQELAGGNLSAAIAPRSAATSKSRRAAGRASTRSPFASGSARAGRSGSSASSSASGSTPRPQRVETFRSTVAGRASSSSTSSGRPTTRWSTPTASRPAGAATSASATSATGTRRPEVDPRGRRDPRRAPTEGPAAALRHGRQHGPAAAPRGPRRLSSGSTWPPSWVVRDDRHPDAGGRSARSGCASRTASTSSSTASTSRWPKAPSSPCSDRTAPARRPPSRSSRR